MKMEPIRRVETSISNH